MKTKQTANVLALAKYEQRSHREKITEEWVEYGDDNNFPGYLIELFHASPTHNALCNTIAQMIFGQGFDANTLEGRMLLAQWDINEELRKCAMDLKVQAGFYLEVIWSLDRTTIANVRHIPFENIRCGVANEDEEIGYYYYSKDWKNDKEPEVLPRFNSKLKNEQPIQILAVRPFTIGAQYYAKPDYVGAINYIELEKEVSVFHINNIKNGLSPSFAIHFSNGIPDDEERRQIRNNIERETTGAQNAGKFFMTFSDTPERRPSIEPFPLSDADKQYQFLSEETTAKIMIGHRVTNPQMFGVMVPGKLGGGAELAESAELFDEQVIQPNKQLLLDACQTLMNACGIADKVHPIGQAVETADVTQSYTGIQVTSALDIIAKVGLGELNKMQAIQLLVTMLQFPLEAAERLFAEQTETALQMNFSAALDYLTERGETMDADWELVDERPVDYDNENVLDSAWAFARTIRNAPSKASDQDNDIVRVRYAYAPTTLADDDSRDFCTRMIQATKVYRKEDIIAAGTQAVNPGWGPGGADTYNIWFYKGGGSCRHYWMRQTYLKKNNKLISVNEAKRIIGSLPLEDKNKNRLEENDKRVAQRPRDMKNRGFLKPRTFTTPR
jgi:hypothetical protein